MSEQTPETAATAPSEDGFTGAETEPSMEDILASIRKIIADDADPVPLDGPSDTAQPEPSIQSINETFATADVRPAPVAASVDATSDSLDIDALLSEFDEELPGTETLQESFGQAFGLNDDVDVLSLDDQLAIPEIDASGSDATPVEAALDLPVPTSDDTDDMDRMMSELLVDLDEAPAPTDVAAGIVKASPQEDVKGDTMTDAATDADLDLVKSLMADLTDEDEDPTVGAADAAPVVTADATVDVDPIDALEDDILESILDMTLDDEIAAMEAQAREADTPNLMDIAAAADAAADAIPSADIETIEEQPVETIAPTQAKPTSVEPQPAPQPTQSDTPEMETSMPRAIRSDAILDDVTEEATMSAFAQLNQVVEDKAIFNERGPRIGDLVQDALRPMLKEWLDENLQGIVERAVAKEVQRLATGK